jgi:acyl-coenzyme A synthetase/AMP-(fatty) acid ligase
VASLPFNALPRTPSMKVSRVELLELFDDATSSAASSRTA